RAGPAAMGRAAPDPAPAALLRGAGAARRARRRQPAAVVPAHVAAIPALCRPDRARARRGLALPRPPGRALSDVHRAAAGRRRPRRVAGVAMPAPIRFDGQVAIVTGAGRGLGAAYARLLAARGAAVVVHDAGVAQDGSGHDPSVADGVVAEIAAAGGTAAASYENLEDASAGVRLVDFAVARFGRLDAL